MSPAMQLSRGLLGSQGLRGTVGLMTGFRRAGARHKKLVHAFISAVAKGDKSAALDSLSSTATITLGDNDVLDVAELVVQLDGGSWTKTNSAGSTVAISLGHGRGIMFADVAWRGSVMNRVLYFPPDQLHLDDRPCTRTC